MTCNVCSHPERLEQATARFRMPSNVRAFRHETFTLWRCGNCCSLHSQEGVDLARYYRAYPVQNQRADFFTRSGLRNRLSMLMRLGLLRGQRVLDYGCGNGLFVDYLRQAGFDAEGYDAYIPRFEHQTRLGTFDAICSQDVIEHVEDPKAMASQCAKMLRPGGMVFIGTPNADEVDPGRGESIEIHQPYHRHILSESALEYVAALAGLRKIGCERLFYSHTLTPFLNVHFFNAYIATSGGAMDVLYEQPNYMRLLTSPRLLLLAFWGGMFPAPGHMLMAFRKE